MAVLIILAIYAVFIITFSIISFFIIYHLTHYTVDSEFKIVMLVFFFIVYHLVKYSVDPAMKLIMLVFFVLVSAGLFLSNLALFFSTNWNEIITKLLSPNL